MNHEQIEAVAAVLQESPALTEIELRGAGVSLRLRRARPKPQKSAAPRSNPTVKSVEKSGGPAAEVSKLVPVTAAVVGVFRVMGGAATVSVGDIVRAGQVLGQIEAIRLLNDCIAPAAGRVSLAAVQEGQPVEYGQLLFEIAPEEAQAG